MVLNSDAHIFSDVGRRDYSEALIREMGFPEELIINRSPELFKEYLQRKRCN